VRLIHFNDLAFDAGMMSVIRGDGVELKLTRQERSLLLLFTKQPGRLLTRARLVELMARDDSDTSERNIDFLVNRLRKILGDNARNPRFIATRYGEGYVWIAEPAVDEPVSAFLLIGPAYGLRGAAPRERDVLAHLTKALHALIGIERTVACLPDWHPKGKNSDNVTYRLDASFHRQEATLHAAFVLRHVLTRQVIGAFRARFSGNDNVTAIDALAAELKKAIWTHLAIPAGPVVTSIETPLEIRLHDAALLLARTPVTWRENEDQLALARAEQPDDPKLAIMWGLNLYSRLLSQAIDDEPMMPQAEWEAIEDEIEALALASPPKVQDNPLLVLGVAKLLFFINRGHFELAAQLADEAFAKSTAFAAAFALQAQIRMCQGEIPEALAFYDKGIEMSEHGSAFHLYLIVLKCTALLAANQRAALDQLCAELYAIKPITRLELGLLMADPKASKLAPDVEAMLVALDEDRARKLMSYFYNIFARRFLSKKHRRNVVRGLTTHMVRRFGNQIVPEVVARTLVLSMVAR
jgi:DNA-binding winged helix-turn-helix (wHTH) protein